MLVVLKEKFNTVELKQYLINTGTDTLLLSHNMLKGLDPLWSDNKVGDGCNWTGLQLMLIRCTLYKNNKKYIECIKFLLSIGISQNLIDNFDNNNIMSTKLVPYNIIDNIFHYNEKHISFFETYFLVIRKTALDIVKILNYSI